MRRLVVGLDGNGNSCVLEEADFVFQELVPGIAMDTLYETHDSPPLARPEGSAPLLPLGIGPGLVR